MKSCACSFLAAAVLILSGTAFAASARDVTSALDRAHTQQDFLRQAGVIEGSLRQSKSQPPEMLAQLSRAWYLMAEAEKNNDRKLDYTNKSIDAADRALRADPGKTHALYWRSMALLQEADISGGFTGLRDVKAALKGLEAVSAKEPAYDSAGAYRSWGKVLIEAPAWAFIGDKKKGLELLRKATEIAPYTLVNRLYLAQAYKANGQVDNARKEIDYIRKAPLGSDPAGDREIKQEAEKLYKNL